VDLHKSQQYYEIDQHLMYQINFFGNFLKKSKKYFVRHDAFKSDLANLPLCIFKIVLYRYLFYYHRNNQEENIAFENFAPNFKQKLNKEYEDVKSYIEAQDSITTLDNFLLSPEMKSCYEIMKITLTNERIYKKENNYNLFNKILNYFLTISNLFAIEFEILFDGNNERFYISTNEILIKIKVFIDLNKQILYQFIEDSLLSQSSDLVSKNSAKYSEESLKKIAVIIALLYKSTDLDINKNSKLIEEIIANFYNPSNDSITKSSLATFLNNHIIRYYKDLNFNSVLNNLGKEM